MQESSVINVARSLQKVYGEAAERLRQFDVPHVLEIKIVPSKSQEGGNCLRNVNASRQSDGLDARRVVDVTAKEICLAEQRVMDRVGRPSVQGDAGGTWFECVHLASGAAAALWKERQSAVLLQDGAGLAEHIAIAAVGTVLLAADGQGEGTPDLPL